MFSFIFSRKHLSVSLFILKNFNITINLLKWHGERRRKWGIWKVKEACGERIGKWQVRRTLGGEMKPPWKICLKFCQEECKYWSNPSPYKIYNNICITHKCFVELDFLMTTTTIITNIIIIRIGTIYIGTEDRKDKRAYNNCLPSTTTSQPVKSKYNGRYIVSGLIFRKQNPSA